MQPATTPIPAQADDVEMMADGYHTSCVLDLVAVRSIGDCVEDGLRVCPNNAMPHAPPIVRPKSNDTIVTMAKKGVQVGRNIITAGGDTALDFPKHPIVVSNFWER